LLNNLFILVPWGLGIGPNPQSPSPIPNPQSPIPQSPIKLYKNKSKSIFNLNISSYKNNNILKYKFLN
jgi:hypothetical protein